MSDTTSTMRTDYCGELGLDDQGRRVAVCGWVNARREHSAPRPEAERAKHVEGIAVEERAGCVRVLCLDGVLERRQR